MRGKILIIIIIMFAIVVFVAFLEMNKTDYNIGRDTVEAFGKGRFQLLRGGGIKSLYDCKEMQTIAYGITRYRKIKEKVYIVSEKEGYTILNYQTEEYSQSHNIDDFSHEEQDIFNNANKFKKVK